MENPIKMDDLGYPHLWKPPHIHGKNPKRASHAAFNCLDCTFTLLQYIDLLSVNDKNIQAG